MVDYADKGDIGVSLADSPQASHDDEVGDRILEQMMDLWVRPEIERRQRDGSAPSPFGLSAAQVILSAENSPPVVRLNQEIRCVVRGRAIRDVAASDFVSLGDLDAITELELTSDDANAGHVTLILVKDRYFVAFDFRYNAAHVAERLAVADQFLTVAEASAERQCLRPFVELLFAATELMAAAILIQVPTNNVLRSKKHGYVRGEFNRWGHMGNVKPEYVQLLNRLWDMREGARYLGSTFELEPEEAARLLSIATEMRGMVDESAPRRFPTSERLREEAALNASPGE